MHKKMADTFNIIFAKQTKFTTSIGEPGKTTIGCKVSHQSYLEMEKTYKVQITISTGPELVGGNVLQTLLSHSHTGVVTAKLKKYLTLFQGF